MATPCPTPTHRVARPWPAPVRTISCTRVAIILFDQETNDLNHSVPMLFDILLMRPMGLLMTAMGTAVYIFPVAPVMLLTRPSDVAKPLGPLVATPARFTFVDPIGQHPPVQ